MRDSSHTFCWPLSCIISDRIGVSKYSTRSAMATSFFRRFEELRKWYRTPAALIPSLMTLTPWGQASFGVG